MLAGLNEYVDGVAGSALCAEIERHLADCADCRVVVDTLRKTVELVHTLPAPDLPDGLRTRLFRALALDDLIAPTPPAAG